jgi:hypothetical protein
MCGQEMISLLDRPRGASCACKVRVGLAVCRGDMLWMGFHPGCLRFCLGVTT